MQDQNRPSNYQQYTQHFEKQKVAVSPDEEKKRKEKKLLQFLGVVLVIVIMFNIYYFFWFSKEHFSDNPKKWVDEVNDSKILNLTKALSEGGYEDSVGEQQYIELKTAFSSEGWYKGEYFLKNHPKMRITTNIVPNDDVLDGYIIERLENNELYAYIFLDSDWKEQFPNAKIYWGTTYQNNQSFDFDNEIEDGIFLTKVKDDQNRFLLNYSIHKGGFIVGDLREDNFSTIMKYN